MAFRWGFTFESDEAGRSVFKERGASSGGGRRLALAGAGPGKKGLWVRKWPPWGKREGPLSAPRPNQALIVVNEDSYYFLTPPGTRLHHPLAVPKWILRTTLWIGPHLAGGETEALEVATCSGPHSKWQSQPSNRVSPVWHLIPALSHLRHEDPRRQGN